MARAVSRTPGRTSGGWIARIRSVFGQAPVHEASGRGRRSLAWMPSNPGAVAALLASGADLRIKSRDLVRRNAWAQAGIEAFVANAVGTGIKPQSLSTDDAFKADVQALWRDWTEEADAAGQTDFYGLQALACRAMLEGGECLIRLRPRRPEDGLSVPLQLQLLEAEHLPMTLNVDLPSGNVVRSGIEFDGLGRRVAYHLYRSHPDDGRLAPMSGQGGLDTVRVDASEVIHLFRVLRPGQIRGEPWLSRALVKLNELDQYDDAELVRKKTVAMFAGFVTRQSPEDNLMGESLPDEAGISLVGLEPGTLQILEPGEDIKFSDPADVGGSYGEFLRTQFRAVAAALGITYEQLTGDLTGVNYSSIRAGLLEFRRRCEMVQHSVLVHQMCRPVWAVWMKQAVLSGALIAPGFARGGTARRRQYLQAKWIPQGWQWVDPEKEFKAMLVAIRAGLMSRSEAISTFGYDAEDIDREIAADNARADALGLIFDSDPRHTAKDGAPAASRTDATAGEPIAA
ncbi:phage portal protein (plasmid) [Ralstonia solanacearum P673]|uniref:phage portal protein n=1 Tax=Ralstonia solanacearum TaxID=305 RepID=UPI00202A9F98|nr:phage portal protein [Ralstonia solanacearum]MCL9851876.1 phage portal protein [Ralstonia solanacearum]MCL9856901.1 phage portal protein [Ralstonia solanacearum]MCL9861638.1 phage portal protein [Ralstonia solanacearum]MCL9866535.1 phage portal protein [Ralstonia solanacearum]MCL9871274.1 phage portal protein [Ralstonia solanacearum]